MTATAPVRLDGISDYVVEAEIQVVDYTLGGSRPIGSFGVVVRASGSASDGYGVGHYANGGRYYAMMWPVSTSSAVIQQAEFKPGGPFHSYRVEVRANTLTLIVDGVVLLGPIQDNRFVSGGRVGLWSDDVQISVRSFKVTAL